MMIDNIHEDDNERSVNRKQFDEARPF